MISRAFFAIPFLLIALAGCVSKDVPHPVVKRDHCTISYTDSGGEGATLLFVHGLYNDKTYWAEQVKYFSSDYRVVTLDLPGHGESGKERPHWTLRGYAGDVYTLIKELDLKNVILIGHSMGGDINLMAATYRPKNIVGFIGIDNFKNAATAFSEKEQREISQFRKALQKDFKQANSEFIRNYLTTSETPNHVVQKIQTSFDKADKAMGLPLMDEIFALHGQQARLLPELHVKMHLINTAQPPTNTAVLKKLAGKGYSLRTINATSHYPMIEQPRELNNLIRETIEQIARENDTIRI